MCMVCRRRFPKGELRRVALVGGRFVWDPVQRAGGRGGYLCRSPRCLSAFSKGQQRFLQRAFSRKIAKDGGEVKEYLITQGE